MISPAYYDNIRDFFKFLQDNNISFFPIAGTLLGCYREGGLIQHDSDVDIAIDVKDYDKVKSLIESSGIYHFHMTWRRELCVIKHLFRRSESQIDVFFMERKGDDYLLIDYEANSFSGTWDIERCLKFKYEWFESFNTVKFLGMDIQIPVGTEQILEAHYGDWRTPTSNWKTEDSKAYVNDYRQIAIIIPTFLRDNCLKILVESIKKTLPKTWYKLYIGDQGYSDLSKDDYYKQLKSEGHFVSYLSFNSGLSYTRNYLVSKTVEPLILLVDDDFEFNSNTKIQNMIQVLNDNPKMGVVGGNLEAYPRYHYYMFKQDNKLYYVQPCIHPRLTTPSYCQKSVPYVLTDIVLNFAMFKREIFNDIKWDAEQKMAEHSLFYYTLKQLNKWQVGYVPDVTAKHQTKDNPPDYQEFRSSINNQPVVDLCLKKLGLKNMNDIVYLRESK